MKEKPILFSTPMVQAILNGRKTQTRRVVKPQPGKDDPNIRYCTIEGFQCAPPGEEIWADTDEGESFKIKPKYNIGDILWVRETYAPVNTGEYIYKADRIFDGCEKGDISWNWKPSIFMPREAARLFLEVKSVRVERLQDITIADVQSEGITMEDPPAIRDTKKPDDFDKWSQWKKDEHVKTLARCIYMSDLHYVERHIYKYAKLWDSLNAKRGYSWESNPWVFAYTFKKIDTGGEK